MSPGTTQAPLAFISIVPGGAVSPAPMAEMRPSAMSRSKLTRGCAPVPSITVALRMTNIRAPDGSGLGCPSTEIAVSTPTAQIVERIRDVARIRVPTSEPTMRLRISELES